MRYLICVVMMFLIVSASARAQSPNATLNGQVVDSSGGAIAGASIDVVNVATNVRYSTKTNAEGMYLLPELPAANYEIQVSHGGFKTIVKPDVLLNVRDAVVINFILPLGAVSERVTVEGGISLINTQDAAVSTVVDRQFAENLPLDGRSFQTLVALTPGVTLTVTNAFDNGQFSVNGQRAASNYWMVDGVSANVGISSTNQTGNGLAGAMPSFSVLGGTNSLVSVDAMQEFRINTSTYAPEFGRTPGGQISIATRSGTNLWHGSAFEYLRNDVFDANSWFANFASLPKPRERQNDFGGTFSGPIIKDRTFFFFSYEGLRLRLPQVALTSVPDIAARQKAVLAMQPFLNAFPLPNGSDNLATGVAQFNGSFSNPATLDAYSLRSDHKFSNSVVLFARYNYSPSELLQRGPGINTLSNVVSANGTTQTGTVGATWSLSPVTVNDVRFNYSRTSGGGNAYLDKFGGAVPLASLPFPSPHSSQDSQLFLNVISLGSGLTVGPTGLNLQRQINIVDNLSLQRGSHSLKFGIDVRRLSPLYGNYVYSQNPNFLDVPSAEAGNLFVTVLASVRNAALTFSNLGSFAQDTWRVLPRLTITYGLRWDLDFAPASDPAFSAVTGFNLSDLSKLNVAAPGTHSYNNTYGNVAPRIGVAYQLSQDQGRQTVLRGGFGVFYDLASSEAGNLAYYSFYPFGATGFVFGGNFPLTSTAAAPPPITAPGGGSGTVRAFDPNLKLPYTLQWNVALEQSLGRQQSITASYVGSAGRRLIQSAFIRPAKPNFTSAYLVSNLATSDYDALQVQFQRRLARGLQALTSYTWSHSIDDASAGSVVGNRANAFLRGTVNQNRGPSDFDIRNAFSMALTYDIPAPKLNAFSNVVLRGWSLDNILQARSAPPVTASVGALSFVNQSQILLRPNVKPGVPLYLYGSQYPGGKVFNNTPIDSTTGCIGAFCPPPSGQQGNLGRNALRAFGAWQWDFAVHRDLPIRESLKLQFRAEMFNALNHPNFAPPVADITNTAQFGRSTQTLGSFLANGNVGNGALSPLYQVGGPRSVQFGLKLQF